MTTSLHTQATSLSPDWRPIVEAFLSSEKGLALAKHLDSFHRADRDIFPQDVFAALRLTPLSSVKVCILGQDPYHGPNQAHGLSFSVQRGTPIPPSLRNIRKEIERDLGIAPPAHGSLEDWAKQGVLLLNTALTVESGAPGSHSKIGWERLTDDLIRAAASTGAAKVFMLWGAHAQRKRSIIELAASGSGVSALILESNHPSPLSALRPPLPFIGNGHFSEAAAFLSRHGRPLDWAIA